LYKDAMIGSIAEKQPTKVAPLLVSRSVGFPVPTRRAILPGGVHNPQNLVHAKPGAKMELSEVPRAQNTVLGEEDKSIIKEVNESIDMTEVGKSNMDFIAAMSENEREDALAEIRSLLSQKSVAFLTKKTSSGYSQQSLKVVGNVSQLPVRKQLKGTGSVDSNLNADNQDKPKFDIFSSVEMEEFDAKNAQVPSGSVRNNVIEMFAERFDLDGRKVVDPRIAAQKMAEVVRKLGLFKCAEGGADEEGIGSVVASILLKHMVAECDGEDAVGVKKQSSPFFVLVKEANSVSAVQPQNELLHHQFEQTSPGYNTREISEVSWGIGTIRFI
jgi:hypothetical protein